MSDGYQVLGFDTVAAGEAQKVVDTALDWMKAAGFISAIAENCVYSADGLGYRPGANWSRIVDDTRSWPGLVRRSGPVDSAPPPSGAHPYDIADFLGLATNGVHSSTGRIVCDSGQNWSGLSVGGCPACGAEVDPKVDLGELAGAWLDGKDTGVHCPRCSTKSRLEDWDFQPYWAFAEAELTFWNWPPLSEQFAVNLTKRLSVPRLRHIVGHL